MQGAVQTHFGYTKDVHAREETGACWSWGKSQSCSHSQLNRFTHLCMYPIAGSRYFVWGMCRELACAPVTTLSIVMITVIKPGQPDGQSCVSRSYHQHHLSIPWTLLLVISLNWVSWPNQSTLKRLSPKTFLTHLGLFFGQLHVIKLQNLVYYRICVPQPVLW